MVQTFQAVVVALVVILPGAVYTIARESQGASWAWRQTDAGTILFRFLCASAVYHAFLAPLTYCIYQELILTRKLSTGQSLSWWWWGALLAYVAVPFLGGVFTEKGRAWRDSANCVKKAVSKFVSLYAGSSPEPRAWDWFFDKRPTGLVRLRLNDGEWKAGVFDQESFASGYGEEGDIYLVNTFVVDETGVIQDDETDGFVSADVGLLVRWSEVRYLEFGEWQGTTPTDADEGSEEPDPDIWKKREKNG